MDFDQLSYCETAGKRSDADSEDPIRSVPEHLSLGVCIGVRLSFFFGLNGAPSSLTTGALAAGGVSLSLFGIGGIRRCRG